MREVRGQLRALDLIEAPDLRDRIKSWEPRTPRTEPSLGRVGIALLAFVVAAAGIAFAIRAFRATESPIPAATIENGKIAFVTDLTDNPRIWTMNPDGSDPVQLSNGRDPAWSPDGSRIVFTTDRDRLGIDVMSADGKGVKELVRDPAFAQEPAWSPDGRKIAFMASDGIYVMNADGSGVHRVTAYSGPRACGDFDPSWSPDGNTIAFAVKCDGGGLGIWTVAIDGSDRTLLIGPEDDLVTFGHPAWWPDGTKIVYEVVTSGPFVQPTYVIYVVDVDGGRASKLVDGQQPTWSPDGTKIAFVRDQGIHVMSADGTDIKRITGDRAPYSEPAWQPIPIPGETPRPTETPMP